MTSEAQRKAAARYQRAALVQVALRLNKNTEADLIEHLGKQENKQGYLKRLIREDMDRQGEQR